MSAQCGHGSSAFNGPDANGAGNSSSSGPYEMTICGVPMNSPPEVYKNQIHSGAIAT